jgi:sec-independent protein translocase protein TatA
MFEGLSPLHLILVLAIALIIVGPGKLPEVGASLGKAIRGFREAVSGNDEKPQNPSSPPSA